MDSTPKAIRVLVIEDWEDDALLLARHFRVAGYDLTYRRVDCAKDMTEALNQECWDLILCDHSMPGFSALAALKLMQGLGLDLPFIIVSGVIEEDTAIAAMRAGASDYLSKERLERLIPAVERELREARNRAERRAAIEAVRESEARFRALTSNIPGMVFQMARRANGELDFLYVSEGANPVLALTPEELIAFPGRFRAMIVSNDLPAFDAGVAASAETFATVNWEGRIVLPDEDIKWVNLRASPRRLGDGRLVWEGIVANITQSKVAQQELRQSRAQLAELSSHLQRAKEEERERIARDIHDELGGNLVAIKIEAALLASKTRVVGNDQFPAWNPADMANRVNSIGKLIDDAIATVGRVARELRPGILKDFGLVAAIESQGEDFAQRTGITCHVTASESDFNLPEDAAISFFRVFQEALTNISKHARATLVEVCLTLEDGAIVMEIGDNGVGLGAEDLSKPKSFGLRGMRERINGLSGVFEIRARAGGGTLLTMRVPTPSAPSRDEFACVSGDAVNHIL